MRRGWLVRLKTVLLTAVILSGGGGMPLLDLVLYHGLAPDRSSVSHFESHTPHGHGDSCRLSSSLSHCPQVDALTLHLPAGTITSLPPALPASAPRAVQASLHLARAPPNVQPLVPVPQLT
jgi:hypothetical protein